MDNSESIEAVKADPLMKIPDVAKIFDVTPGTIRLWLREGTIKGTKIGTGHYWRIPQSEVIRVANERYGSGAEA